MKKIVCRLQIISILIGICQLVNAQKIINLSDYGITPDSYQNASPALAQAIKDASGFDSCIIKFPGGRIDLWPEGASQQIYYISNATENDSCPKVKTIGMLFKDLSNVTIEGNNTLLVYHGKMMLMAIEHCNQVVIKNNSFGTVLPQEEIKISLGYFD